MHSSVTAECTFEDVNMCGWTNIHGDNFDWTRASGATASLGTGPRADHTYGTNQGTFYKRLVLVSTPDIVILVHKMLRYTHMLGMSPFSADFSWKGWALAEICKEWFRMGHFPQSFDIEMGWRLNLLIRRVYLSENRGADAPHSPRCLKICYMESTWKIKMSRRMFFVELLFVSYIFDSMIWSMVYLFRFSWKQVALMLYPKYGYMP